MNVEYLSIAIYIYLKGYFQCKSENRKEKSKASISSPMKSPNTVMKEKEKVDLTKFKESLVKMDPSHLRDLIENPRNAKPIVRKNFEELIKVKFCF